jgi:hypothetical protein
MSYKDKKFTIIISSYRCSTTTLCNKVRNNDIGCLYEVFGAKLAGYRGRVELEGMYPIGKGNYETYLNIVCENVSQQDILAKVFYNHLSHHLVGMDIADEIWSNLNINKFIFLSRDLRDSYNSLTTALQTGNWGTDPERKRLNKISYKGKHIAGGETFESYQANVANWMNDNREWASANNIPTIELSFDEVIRDDFDGNGLV